MRIRIQGVLKCQIRPLEQMWIRNVNHYFSTVYFSILFSAPQYAFLCCLHLNIQYLPEVERFWGGRHELGLGVDVDPTVGLPQLCAQVQISG